MLTVLSQRRAVWTIVTVAIHAGNRALMRQSRMLIQRHRVIALGRFPGPRGKRVECAALSCPSPLAGSQVTGSDRAGLVDASHRKDGSVGVDRFGFRVTRQIAGLTFVGKQLRFVGIETLGAILVRLGGSTRRLCALPGSAARCGGFGEADAQADRVEIRIKKFCKTTPCKVGLWLKLKPSGSISDWSLTSLKEKLIKIGGEGAPEHWRALEPTFTRVRFLPDFAETFGRLIVTVRDGIEQDIRNLTILSEAMQQIFPADAAVIAAPVRRRTQARRDRARMGLEGRFGQTIPSPTEMSNGVLCREVVQWLAEHHPLPPGNSEISNDSILRAAARKQ
jgi:hypothetical protein